jgi:3-demethoxyubiquinol 3-hydroxylase
MTNSSGRQDQIVAGIDKVLRTLCGPAVSERPTPGAQLLEPDLSPAEKRHAAALMRVNHTGEICAQALYQGQALTARDPSAKGALELAAKQETEHLAWTANRIEELGGRTSRLNPLFYLGSFAIGGVAGLLGDKINLGFLAETERQVEGHLVKHLERLPDKDKRSRAILVQMKEDEAAHARTARSLGGDELPTPVRQAMKLCSRIMTGTTYWV